MRDFYTRTNLIEIIYNKKNNENKAFTLIELLVVIAIIGLLASIVIVSVNSARERARITAGMKFGQSIKHSIGSELVGEWSFDNDDARDDSGNGNDGIINGPTPIDGIIGRAMSFDGIDDYVNCGNDPSLDINDAITFEAWIYIIDLPESTQRTIVSKGYSYWELQIENKKLTIEYPGANAGNTIFENNKWYHVAWTFDKDAGADNSRLYVNGEFDGAFTRSTPLASTDNPVRIGERSPSSCGPWKGMIDEVRIYSKALSSTEIQQHYAEGLKKLKLAGKITNEAGSR